MSGSVDVLEAEFKSAMDSLYHEAKNAKFRSPTLLAMIADRGAVGTAKYFLQEPQVSAGFKKLKSLDRLDLTIEAIVARNPKFYPLFSIKELEVARKRLLEAGFPME